jgi:hypothetical protein
MTAVPCSSSTARRHVLRWRVAVGLIAVYAIVVGVALTSISLRQKPINNWGGGGECAFPDGVNYCAMAAGELGTRPFSHRPLVPFLAGTVQSLSGWTVIDSFKAVGIAGFVLTNAAIVALGWVLARRMGVRAGHGRTVVALAALSWSLTPFALRFVLNAPVLTDELATGLTVAWLASLLAPGPRPLIVTLAPALALLATTAREAAFPTVVATCLIAVMLGVLSRRGGAANAGAAVLGLVFDLTRTAAPASYDPVGGMLISFHYLRDPHAVFAGFGMGVGFAMVALVPTVWIRLIRSRGEARWLCVLLPAALFPLCLATFAGQDLPRLSSPASPVLYLVLSAYVVLVADVIRVGLVVAMAAVFISQWNVFIANGRSWWRYMVYFYGMETFRPPIVIVLAVLALALLVADLRALRGRAERSR